MKVDSASVIGYLNAGAEAEVDASLVAVGRGGRLLGEEDGDLQKGGMYFHQLLRLSLRPIVDGHSRQIKRMNQANDTLRVWLRQAALQDRR